MRLPGSVAVLSFIHLPFLVAAVGNLSCELIRADGISFDLSGLEGARSVVHNEDNGLSTTNTTYTIDVCKPLGKIKNSKIPVDQQCPSGSRVCAVQRVITKDTDTIEKVIPIAGELLGQGGGNLDAKPTRLKNSPGDGGKEGLRLVMNGGFIKSSKRKQKAIIDFICDKSKTGLENLPNPEDQYDDVKERRAEKSENVTDTTPSLQFVNYGPDADDNIDVLHLTWITERGCEDFVENHKNDRKPRWGFFTWFIIVAFMSTAAYLIFGSWLNYNRYGARGWDLLPHGDTIRDVPYLMKDWTRRVINTVQGSGSRGGYAAV